MQRNLIRPDELPWLRGLLSSPKPRDRVYGLNAVAHRGTTEEEALSLCEGLLADRTITLLGIPYSFGEVRSCAVDAVLTSRRLRGESAEVEIEDLARTLSPGSSRAFAEKAGIAPVGGENPVDAEIATFNAAAHVLPRRRVKERSLACFDERLALLREVAWVESSEARVQEARDRVREYYKRLLPFWPSDREQVGPADAAFFDAALAPRTDAQRERIEAEAQTLLANVQRVDTTTRRLVRMVLAWAMAIDSAERRVEEDPSVPLIDVWCLGITFEQEKTGIQFNFADGWGTIPFPSRTTL